MGCVQSAGAGVTLTRPKICSDIVPCEMSFTAHPMAQEFHIKSIVIVSEARNVEMYIDDNYEKTARGIMLTIRKGRYNLNTVACVCIILFTTIVALINSRHLLKFLENEPISHSVSFTL